MAAPLRKVCKAAKAAEISLRFSSRKLHTCERRCEKWQLYSAVCLERYPVITKSFASDVTRRYSEYLDKVELERSHLSNHELRHREDLRKAKERQNNDLKEVDVQQTALEFEDEMEVALKTFTPAFRVTEADKANDLKSTERKLDRKLFLLVKQKLGEKDYWVLPQGRWSDGQSMRESAEQTLIELCGDVPAVFLGNAPCGVVQYEYPEQERSKENCDGAKVFVFKAMLKDGAPGTLGPPSPEVSDYLWVTKEEMHPYIVSNRYRKKIKDFMMEL